MNSSTLATCRLSTPSRISLKSLHFGGWLCHLLLLGAGIQASAVQFSNTGSMAITRVNHTATALPNGKVLVTGGGHGVSNTDNTDDCRLYNPATGTWDPAPPMSEPRAFHAATLLPGGLVLVTGGEDFRGQSQTFEVYDSNLNSWGPAYYMISARSKHTATLMPGIGVLLCSGAVGPPLSTTSCEIYNFTTVTTATYPTPGILSGHTAALLNSGDVLVAGGTTAWAGVYLYNSATGWSAVSSAVSTGSSTTLVKLPDGRVLIAGNSGAQIYDPVIGSCVPAASCLYSQQGASLWVLSSGAVLRSGGSLMSAETYHPAADQWLPAGNSSSGRENGASALMTNGKVLFVGGHDPVTNTDLSTAELYNVSAANSWSLTGNFTTGRRFHSSTVLNDGTVLLAGGTNGSVSFTSSYIYTPATGTWAATGNNLPAPKAYHTSTLLPDGKCLVVGGYSGGSLSSAALYDPTTGLWSSTGSLANARYGHQAVLLNDGNVLVLGGYTGPAYRSDCELYNTSSGSFSAVASMTSVRYMSTATLLNDGRVLVAGGQASASSYLSTSEIFDPATGTWSSAGSFSGGRAYHTATLLPSGEVLITGGSNGSGSGLASSSIYSIATGWSSTGSLPVGRWGHSATLLPTGEILVVSGNQDNTVGTINNCALYNRQRGTWVSTTSIATSRVYHTAALLPTTGKVLIMGGHYSTTAGSVYLTHCTIY